MNYAEAGDIVAVAKLQHTLSGDTLCDKSDVIRYLPLDYPKPALYYAIEVEDKKDEDKVFSGLSKLREEDPSFVIERNSETGQTLIGGQGEIQLGVIMAKLKDRFGVEVKVVPQKIAYRETIRGTSDVQGKHKKQSGGAGQYGDVHIKFSPSTEEFEFTESLFGGSIPKNYVPAVEKGLIESMNKGPLAGCKVVNIKAELYDGSYHDVDSSEMAFKIAASIAFKKGVMEPQEDGSQKIIAEAPQAELFDYSMVLRSMTQARGNFEMEFARYENMPQSIAERIISQYQNGESK